VGGERLPGCQRNLTPNPQGLRPTRSPSWRAATTAADVDAVARKYFPASHVTVVAVGEEKVIGDALAPFALPMEAAK